METEDNAKKEEALQKQVKVCQIRIYLIQSLYKATVGLQKLIWNNWSIQGFQYFSSLPVLHSLQVVLFLLKLEQFSWISYTTPFKSGGTKDHLRWVKVPGTAPYWKACINILFVSNYSRPPLISPSTIKKVVL